MGETIEVCFACGEPTGRAGKSEDSIYCDECEARNLGAYQSGHPDWHKSQVTTGPYCEFCFAEHKTAEHSDEGPQV